MTDSLALDVQHQSGGDVLLEPLGFGRDVVSADGQVGDDVQATLIGLRCPDEPGFGALGGKP